MGNQYIDNCKYLLLARCSRLSYLIEAPSRAITYADRLLEITPKEIFSSSDFEKFEKFLENYCLAMLIGKHQWARESVEGIETLVSESTECTYLF